MRRVGSHKFVVPPITEHSKVRRHAQLVQPSVPGSPGCQRGRCPSVSERVQRKPFQGFSLGNFFLTADAVLLCAAKKNGVGTTRLAGFCQFKMALAPRREVKNAPLWQALPKRKPSSSARWQTKKHPLLIFMSRGRKLAVPPLVACFSRSRPYRVPIGILRDNGRDRHTPNRFLSGGSSGRYFTRRVRFLAPTGNSLRTKGGLLLPFFAVSI